MGERVGRYEVVSEVSRGGMAAVYAVRLSSIGGFGKLLAMKVLLPHLREERQFVDMFLDEARIASQIQHPNVVQVFDLGEHEGTPFLVMEYLRGRSLSGVLKAARKSESPVGIGPVLGVLARAAEGLHAAHETRGADGKPLGVVHRDVSPQNIHVGYDGHVKVVDFGIAAARGRVTETRSGQLKGKFHYLAPEQISRAQRVDRRADVWALGVVAWELLVGQRLFRGEDDAVTLWNVMNKEVPSLSTLAPRVPTSAADLLDRCLRREREQRPASCAEVAEVLDVAARRLGGASTSELAAIMERLFAAQRAVEEERLASAMREDGPPPVHVDDSGSDTSEVDAAEPPTRDLRTPSRRPGRARALVAAAAAVAVLGAGAGGWWLLSSDAGSEAHEEPAPEPVAAAPEQGAPATTGAPVGEPDAGAPAEPELTTIELEIGPRAQLVLVDRERHDERPVQVQLVPGATAEVQLVTSDGEVVTRTVSPQDDGERLAIEPEPQRRRSRRAAPRHRPRRQADPPAGSSGEGDDSKPLLTNPY